jgi:hypothetical protein
VAILSWRGVRAQQWRPASRAECTCFGASARSLDHHVVGLGTSVALTRGERASSEEEKNMRLAHRILAGLTVVGTLAVASTASAQDNVVVTQPAQPATQPVVVTNNPQPVADRVEYAGPNRALIASGLITFGISYGVAAIVAGTSPRSEDRHLYVPVAGPWIDLANRPSCGPENIACDTETMNKVLLVADGIFQGLGVIQIISGFAMPEERRVVTTTAKVRVTPTTGRATGTGLALVGTF